MAYLIDTNILLWFALDNNQLPKKHKRIIQSITNEIFVSIASLWEIGIKHSLGKLELETTLENFFNDIEKEFFLKILPLNPSHILRSSQLPFIHRDPFDRLIFAQAVEQNYQLLYSDKIFNEYYKLKQDCSPPGLSPR